MHTPLSSISSFLVYLFICFSFLSSSLSSLFSALLVSPLLSSFLSSPSCLSSPSLLLLFSLRSSPTATSRPVSSRTRPSTAWMRRVPTRGCRSCGCQTAYSVQRTAYSVQRTVYSVQRTAYSVQRTAYSVKHYFLVYFSLLGFVQFFFGVCLICCSDFCCCCCFVWIRFCYVLLCFGPNTHALEHITPNAYTA